MALSLSAVIAELQAAGLKGDALVQAMARIEKASAVGRSPGAERQRRYMARKRGVTNDVTNDAPVTNDVSDVSNDAKGAPSPSSLPPKPPILITTPSPKAHITGARARELFAEFWGAYPKRLGTNSTSKAFDKFRASLKSGCDPGEIIAGAHRYREHCDQEQKTGTEFVQQAVTWLNQKGWENEYEKRWNGNGHGRSQPPRKGSIQRSLEAFDAALDARLAQLGEEGGGDDLETLPGFRKGHA